MLFKNKAKIYVNICKIYKYKSYKHNSSLK